MKRVLVLLALAATLGASSCEGTPPSPTVVIVVRHAEKASDADDSPLTEAGVRRAEALVRAAGEAAVGAVYSSQYRRNRDTARPLAERLGVAVTEVPVDIQNPGDYGKRLAREIVERHRGQTVVVVGHGNTIASTVEGLTGRPAVLGEIQYSDFFMVTVPPSGSAGLIRAQYGTSAAADAPSMK